MVSVRHTLLAIGMALLFVGCGGSDSKPEKLPFSAWRDLQAGLLDSPDQLQARADAAIATGSAQKIYEFVRDSIRNRPPSASSFGAGSAVAVLWGPRQTLRYGTGTPRDKAELL